MQVKHSFNGIQMAACFLALGQVSTWVIWFVPNRAIPRHARILQTNRSPLPRHSGIPYDIPNATFDLICTYRFILLMEELLHQLMYCSKYMVNINIYHFIICRVFILFQLENLVDFCSRINIKQSLASHL